MLQFNTPLSRGGVGRDKIYSTPAYIQEDFSGTERSVFLEETPESFSGIESVSVVNTGANYKKTPTITINGDGTGASLRAVIVNGKLKSVIVDNPGTGYTTALLTITSADGDTGTGATAKAVMQGKTGIIRSYYFDDAGGKKILDANAGVIDYSIGTITLNNFAPIEIGDTSKVLKIHAKPDTMEFESARSTIITLDSFDPSAITVNVKAMNT